MSEVLPVREHYLRFEKMADEQRAKDAWCAYVEAHGWTVVGEDAEIRKVPEGWVASGRLIQTSETLDVVIPADAREVRYA